MYNASLENNLISSDIVSLMADHCSIQLDIDETKIKSAAKVAQDLDLKRVIKQENLDRCINPDGEADEELRDLVIPAWCYFTYARCLKMFQGTLTDGGYVVEGEAESRNAAKSAANEMSSIAEVYLASVVEFLEEEDPATEVTAENINPRVRVFGGEENRATN